MDLNVLARTMEVLATEVDQEIQIQTVRALLFVAMRGSCTQKDVENELQATNASISRNIAYWTDRRYDKKPGMNFIMRLEDPDDRRYKVLTLTKKGHEFMDRLRSL